MGRMNELLQIITANSDESVDDLMTILTPGNHDKEELQETFEEVLGYDPTCYFEKDELKSIASDIEQSDNTPENISRYIREHFDELIDDAYDLYESRSGNALKNALAEIIEDRTGWEIEIDTDNSNDDDDDDDYDIDPDYED